MRGAAWFSAVFASVSVLAAGAAAQEPPARLALLVANEDYPSGVGRLSSPMRSAAAMRDTLDAAGFEVRFLENVSREALLTAVSAFALDVASAGEGATGFFFYAGHGASAPTLARRQGAAQRENYLMPAGALITNVEQLRIAGVRLQDVLDRLETGVANAGERAALFAVFDACRNDLPFATAMGGTMGWEPVTARPDMLIAFSTPNGETAPDDATYATVLARELRDETRSAFLSFVAAHDEISERRGFTASPVLTGYGGVSTFLWENNASRGLPTTPARDQDLEDWLAASAEGSAEALGRYLDTHPNGRFREAASRLLTAGFAMIPPMTPTPGGRVLGRSPVGGAQIMDGAGVGATTAPGTVFADTLGSGGGLGPEMVVIPAGYYTMGSTDNDDEGPQRVVTINRPFAAGRFEVTWDDWEACVDAGGCDDAGVNERGGDNGYGRGRLPVIHVDWQDARDYAAWLSRVTGETYRLMSEGEWEYVARAGSQTDFFWGDDPNQACAYANVPDRAEARATGNSLDADCEDGFAEASPAGSFRPNDFGLYDTAGNVLEWTLDCYNWGALDAPSDGSAYMVPDCSSHASRGGSWFNSPSWSRSAFRFGYSTTSRDYVLGLRVAREL